MNGLSGLWLNLHWRENFEPDVLSLAVNHLSNVVCEGYQVDLDEHESTVVAFSHLDNAFDWL